MIGLGVGCLIGLVAFIVTLVNTFFTVDQNEIAIVESFGKFKRIANAGLNIKMPFVQGVKKFSLQINELDIKVETKTKDNVFVKLNIAVQMQVISEKVFDACYKLSNPSKQIESFVYDVVRSKVPTMSLDEVFEKKDDIANDMNKNLDAAMHDYGYRIIKALVNGVEPDSKVKESMNEINAAQRMREAANAKGEAEKTLVVKQAEAEAESKALQGKGIAQQRKAIAEGLKESAEGLKAAGVKADDVMTVLLLTQYFDTIQHAASHSKSNVILMPSNPGAMGNIMAEIQKAILSTSHAVEATKE